MNGSYLGFWSLASVAFLLFNIMFWRGRQPRSQSSSWDEAFVIGIGGTFIIAVFSSPWVRLADVPTVLRMELVAVLSAAALMTCYNFMFVFLTAGKLWLISFDGASAVAPVGNILSFVTAGTLVVLVMDRMSGSRRINAPQESAKA